MKSSVRLLSILAALLAPAMCWGSCSGVTVGADIPVSRLYAEANIAYVGEVVGLRTLTEKPRHNTSATYEVTFQARTLLKGKDPSPQTGTFQHVYYESHPAASGNDAELDAQVVNSDGRHFQLGEKYLILVKRSGALGDIWACDPRVVQLTSLVLEQLKGLAK